MNGSKSILVIDDDQKFSLGLVKILSREGYRVQHVSNGADGLASIYAAKPDLILCDVMMPQMNGLQLKKELAKNADYEQIPFLFVTARISQWDKVMGLGIGADDYITKPFDADELLARIQSVLRRDERGHRRGLKEGKANLDSMKSIIAANLSHEMRTPLTIIISTLDIILKEKFPRDEADLSEYITSVSKSAHRLKFLIEDLEMLYELDRGVPFYEAQLIDLEFHVRHPIYRILKQWEAKHLYAQVNIEPETVIYAPREKFIHILEHLVDNACKFSPNNGYVTIDLKSNALGGCCVEVTNQGDGIPLEMQERVFERFYQVSQGDARKFGGLGVGLTLARAYARAWGGEVMIGQMASAPVASRCYSHNREGEGMICDQSSAGCWVRMVLPPYQLD